MTVQRAKFASDLTKLILLFFIICIAVAYLAIGERRGGLKKAAHACTLIGALLACAWFLDDEMYISWRIRACAGLLTVQTMLLCAFIMGVGFTRGFFAAVMQKREPKVVHWLYWSMAATSFILAVTSEIVTQLTLDPRYNALQHGINAVCIVLLASHMLYNCAMIRREMLATRGVILRSRTAHSLSAPTEPRSSEIRRTIERGAESVTKAMQWVAGLAFCASAILIWFFVASLTGPRGEREDERWQRTQGQYEPQDDASRWFTVLFLGYLLKWARVPLRWHPTSQSPRAAGQWQTGSKSSGKGSDGKRSLSTPRMPRTGGSVTPSTTSSRSGSTLRKITISGKRSTVRSGRAVTISATIVTSASPRWANSPIWKARERTGTALQQQRGQGWSIATPNRFPGPIELPLRGSAKLEGEAQTCVNK